MVSEVSRRHGLEPSMGCVKNLILGLNCMLVLTGMMLIAVGSTIKGVYSNFDELLGNDLISPASFMIAVGAIIFFVAFFGCVGALKESTCMINMYTVALLIIFIFELSAGLAGFAMQTTMRHTLSNNFKYAIQNQYTSDEGMLETIDFLQSRLECCGAESPEDWTGVLDNATYLLQEGDVIVPNSCCGSWNSTEDASECGLPFTEGCLPTLVDIAQEGAMLLTGVAITVALIQAMGVYFSNELAKAIRQAKSLRTLRQMEIRAQLANSYQSMNKSTSEVTPVVYLSGNTADTTA